MKKYKEFKELMEGMNRNMIASFENPDDPEFNFDIYKMGSKFYIDAGNYDDLDQGHFIIHGDLA